jgi:uncharacterized protein HemX
MLSKLFSTMAMKAAAAIIAVLLLALGILWWQNGRISDQRDKAVQLAANERAAHSVTKASLANLEQRMATFIADGERRTKTAQEALRTQQARSAALGSQIALVRAERPSEGVVARCETPAVVLGSAGL